MRPKRQYNKGGWIKLAFQSKKTFKYDTVIDIKSIPNDSNLDNHIPTGLSISKERKLPSCKWTQKRPDPKYNGILLVFKYKKGHADPNTTAFFLVFKYKNCRPDPNTTAFFLLKYKMAKEKSFKKIFVFPDLNLALRNVYTSDFCRIITQSNLPLPLFFTPAQARSPDTYPFQLESVGTVQKRKKEASE
ncbi:predicted protein [Clavispora lusitaniae ATCC 42720]|uniref:Uncharacterized protein n=1 Tax=Clavispora lusitaniae (strain ATCC 42720) TaxID=306902 RepID=C4YAY2_CLAL4|nr:uncharacterized protein CLUG_05447 [Clavispora lusitaniae ATCC 42720]EEQ41319.1 predicted protein [Clavispora lusitaniae ATCC 42720]